MKQLVILITLFFLLPLSALACECLGPYDFKTKEDLEDYQFVVFVRIDSIYHSDIPQAYEHDLFYQADFTILELFKGDSTDTILINGGNAKLGEFVTSCDIGIDKNEKWVIFAYTDENGNLRTGYCTFTTMYASASGVKDWKYERGITELSRLREIFNHEVPSENIVEGVKSTYYSDGTVKTEQSFKNGLPNGQRTIYYPNGQVMIAESYEDGKRKGHSIWYDQQGRIERDYQYLNGYPADTSYHYWPFNGQVRHERIFDNEGNLIRSSSYNRDGFLEKTSHENRETNEYINTSYYQSGEIFYIAIYNLENHQAIRATEFFESGSKEKKWEYYPDDTTKVFQYWQWSSDGELILNYILLNDRTKIDLMNNAE